MPAVVSQNLNSTATGAFAIVGLVASGAWRIPWPRICDIMTARLTFHPRNPGIRAERGQSAGFCEEGFPGARRSLDNGVVVVQQPVREEAFLEVDADALDRIELVSRPAAAPA